MRVIMCLTLALALAGSGEARAMSAMRLTSPAIGPDGRIPEAFSSYGANRSPPLTWTPVPVREAMRSSSTIPMRRTRGPSCIG